MDIETVAPAVAIAIEFVAIAVFVIGAVLAFGAFFVRLTRHRSLDECYQSLRADLGRAILLGIELLVMADIIGTVAIAPSFTNLGVLAIIVLIRTFLSFALEVEVSGRFPWRQHEESRSVSGP
jgi:uncharacterized membrane protein